MKTYGITYQGSKSAIAENIINFLPSGNRFVDLFGGGGAISDCATRSGKWKQVLYNEINPLLVQLIQDAVNGKYNSKCFTPYWISREDFNNKKDIDGYIKYIWSFNCNGMTYIYPQKIEFIKKSLHNFIVFKEQDSFIKEHFPDITEYVPNDCDSIKKRRMLHRKYIGHQNRILKDMQGLENLERLQGLENLERLQRLENLERLQRLSVQCGNYLDYIYQDGDIVYCDPPYEQTNCGSYNNFDNQQFYEWVHSRTYPVYYSSYTTSDPNAILVWERDKLVLSDSSNNIGYKTECIYTNKYGIDLVQPLYQAEQLSMF